jgi:hypothetical protein
MALAAVAAAIPGAVGAGTPAPAPDIERELRVPFEDLGLLFQTDRERVLLGRSEYEDLLRKATRKTDELPPADALPCGATCSMVVEQDRVVLRGAVSVEVLRDGLHAVPIGLARVGLLKIELDGVPAPAGRDDAGRLIVFVGKPGKHNVEYEAVAPLQTTAAQQVLSVRLPNAPASSLKVTVPGDVEVRSGAAISGRVFDQAAGVTRLDLVPDSPDLTLVMSLNSRLKRQDRVVVAQSVVIDELTQVYERLHATVTMDVLHQAAREFRFKVPNGFEILQVDSPGMARWEMASADGAQVLVISLRDELVGKGTMHVSAIRVGEPPANWSFPRLEPQDVAGSVAVTGILLEERLRLQDVAAPGVIPIDHSVLLGALPPTALKSEKGEARVRPVGAWYSPDASLPLTARFEKPAARLQVTANTLVSLKDSGLQASGGLAVMSLEEKLFAIDIGVPAGWDMREIKDERGTVLPFERRSGVNGPGVHVELASGSEPGQERKFFFEALSVPDGWYSGWSNRVVAIPAFPVAGATRDRGAVAVDARDDISATPAIAENLFPLDENEKSGYALAGVTAGLAYRYESRPFLLTVGVERIRPRLTAETFSFFVIGREVLSARYEVMFKVGEARAGQVALLLATNTPESLSISGVGGAQVKEYVSEPAGDRRKWVVRLAEPSKGAVHLAVDCQMPLPGDKTGLALDPVRADGVVYQSGFVAVEGSPELDVGVTRHPRKVDVGELVDANYQPGRRLLGVYGFVGDPEPLEVSVARRNLYRVPPSIAQNAGLVTMLGSSGTAQTMLHLSLRNKLPFLELALPDAAVLWSVLVDGKPSRPQQRGNALLLGLPAGGSRTEVTVVYEQPVARLGFWRTVALPAPSVFESGGDGGTRVEIPINDARWEIHTPTGYRVVLSEGAMTSPDLPPIPVAPVQLARALYKWAGGIGFGRGIVGACSTPFMRAAQRSRAYSESSAYEYEGQAGEVGRIAATGETGLPADQSRVDGTYPASKPEAPPAPSAVPKRVPQSAVSGGVEVSMADKLEKTIPEIVVRMNDGEEAAKMPARGWDMPAKKYAAWASSGDAGLKIELSKTGKRLSFRGLDIDRVLRIRLIDEKRVGALALACALGVLLAGMRIVREPISRKTRFLACAILASALAPALPGLVGLALILNGVFYAACALIAVYLLAGLLRRKPGAAAGAAIVAVVLSLPGWARAADAKYTVEMVPPEPVTVPKDSLIVPYREGDTQKPDQVLVPYDMFRELWKAANPEELTTPPAPYAMAGGGYTATLAADDALVLRGALTINVFAAEGADVPLPLDGGVLESVSLDGLPATVRSGVSPFDPPYPARQQANRASGRQSAVKAVPVPASYLYIPKPGEHRLELVVRMKISRHGGWRQVEGLLPVAPSSPLQVRVPDARTEVLFSGVCDRTSHRTERQDETISTAIDEGGRVKIQWRPIVAEGEIDRTLTAESAVLLDVQEDGLYEVWTVALRFRRGQRDLFSVDVPAGQIIEKVTGGNVKGWETADLGGPDGAKRVTVRLLKAAEEQEQFTVTLRQPIMLGGDGAARVRAPCLAVPDAIRHTGRLTIRNSPLLVVRALPGLGVRRTDLAGSAEISPLAAGATEKPLGVAPFQTYEFMSAPFELGLDTTSSRTDLRASLRTILRIAERDRSLETRVELQASDRPVYEARFEVPDALEIETVAAPGGHEWSVVTVSGRKLLVVRFARGLTGAIPVVIGGPVKDGKSSSAVAVPCISVVGAAEQEGDIAVQADPASDVKALDLRGLEPILVRRVQGWLRDNQKNLVKLALHHSGAVYGGNLQLVPRQAEVSVVSATNVRVTDRAIEETTLFHFAINNAGIREARFVLPSSQADARISVPLLRRKIVTRMDGGDSVMVTLELQDEVMNDLKVLVESDRLLVSGREEAVALPVSLTGRTDRRYMAVESAGRDEVVVTSDSGFEPLSRQQKEWAAVAQLFKGGSTRAFMAGAKGDAVMKFTTRQRAAVETAGARIGLARTVLFLDAGGAYRAMQTYQVDNQTEQFLELAMPGGAELWTAEVAGEPVKPVMPDKADPGRIRIPLVKTASGDLDYAVVLHYGGRAGKPGSLKSVDFPLIRSVNIGVELSQVQLRLPRTHKWMHFDGTMREIEDSAELGAGLLAYQNKVAQRLVRTLQFGSAFEKARSASNLRQLKMEMSETRQGLEGLARNSKVQAELSNSETIIGDADEQLMAVATAGQEVADNRVSMNDAYDGQGNVFERNVVMNQGYNWAPEEVSKAQAAVSGKFNPNWFDVNGLSIEPGPAAKGGKEKDTEGKKAEKADLTKTRSFAAKGQISYGGKSDVFFQQIDQVQDQKPREQSVQPIAPGNDAGERGRDRAGRYARQLRERREANAETDVRQQRQAAAPLGLGESVGVDSDDSGLARAQAATTVAVPAQEEHAAQGPSGLASLKVELPPDDPQRWTSHRFATARGDIRVSAIALPVRFLDSLRRIGLALVAALAVGFLPVLFAGRVTPRGRRVMTSGMIVAGSLGLLAGVFPIACVLLVIGGIVLKLVRASRVRIA